MNIAPGTKGYSLARNNHVQRIFYTNTYTNTYNTTFTYRMFTNKADYMTHIIIPSMHSVKYFREYSLPKKIASKACFSLSSCKETYRLHINEYDIFV